MNLLKQSWAQARANSANTILYILGVALAVCTVMIISIIWHVKLDPIYPEYNRDRTAYLSRMTIKVDTEEEHSSMSGNLTAQVVREIAQDIDCVENLGVTVIGGSTLRVPGTKKMIKTRGFDINSDFLRIYNYDILAGRQFTDDEIEANASKIMIDEDIAKQLYGSAAVAVGKEVDMDFKPKEIIGVFRPTSALAPNSYAQILCPIVIKEDPNVMIAQYSVVFLLKEGRKFEELQQEIKDRLRRYNSTMPEGRSFEFEDGPADQKTQAFNSVTHSGYLYYVAIALLLLMVPAMNLCGLITENLNRRQEEIGVRKSFGAGRTSLLWEIVTENLLLTIAGALLGLLLSWIVISLCGNWVLKVSDLANTYGSIDKSTQITWEMLWSWSIFAYCIAAAFVLNLVASLIPVWCKLRHPIVQSLSSSGRDTESHGLLGRISSNVWIFLELVFITVLAWSIIDPIAVSKAEATDNPGYDFDQLFTIEFNTLPKPSVLFDSTLTSNQAIWNQRQQIMDRIRALPEVESCTQISPWMQFENYGSFRSSLELDSTTHSTYYKLAFLPGTDFFRTYGIKPVKSGLTASDLDNASYAETTDMSDVISGIFTKSIIDFVGGDDATTSFVARDSAVLNVSGIVENVRYNSGQNVTNILFSPFKLDMDNLTDMFSPFCFIYPQFAVRLRLGIDPQKYLDANGDMIRETLSVGNFYVQDLNSYSEKRDKLRSYYGNENEERLGAAMMLFFFANIVLGVIGMCYLQGERRRHEAGVRKAFGAATGQIVWKQMLHGALLAVCAWALGSLLFLQKALSDGLATINTGGMTRNLNWTDNFWLHFGVISMLVLALLLASVAIGLYFPARKSASVTPVDALRSE